MEAEEEGGGEEGEEAVTAAAMTNASRRCWRRFSTLAILRQRRCVPSAGCVPDATLTRRTSAGSLGPSASINHRY